MKIKIEIDFSPVPYYEKLENGEELNEIEQQVLNQWENENRLYFYKLSDEKKVIFSDKAGFLFMNIIGVGVTEKDQNIFLEKTFYNNLVISDKETQKINNKD